MQPPFISTPTRSPTCKKAAGSSLPPPLGEGRGGGSPLPAPESPLNPIYNVAVGDRTTLNPLFTLLRNHLNKLNKLVIPAKAGTHTTPTHRDFRPGDVRHSLADISKARRLLGYEPSHRLAAGVAEAMPWYVGQQP